MEEQILYSTLLLPFRSFREKLTITKEYDRKAKMEIIDNKYVYVVLKEVVN